MIRECLVFFQQFITAYKTTGSFFPSSRWAAKALTLPLRETTCPQNILEVGPGTGSVTRKILSDMMPEDRLTICEINPKFMRELKKQLETNPDYQRHKERVSFFEGSVIDMPEDEKFDFIICAIPFTNLEVSLVEEIFSKLEKLANENTRLNFFEYVGLRNLAKVIPPKSRKERVRGVDAFMKSIPARYQATKRTVWLNLLPIWVHTLKM